MPKTILDTVGGTPLVRLQRVIPAGHATVLLKLEFSNPLSSVKDRIGLAMIEAGSERLPSRCRRTVPIPPGGAPAVTAGRSG